MKKDTLIRLMSMLMVGIFFPALGGSSITLDEIIEQRGFDNPAMVTIGSILASNESLGAGELHQLVHSQQFFNVHTLDLSNQENLTDQHIFALAQNPAFSRLSQIYLSNSQHIGDQAIAALLNSPYIGRIRELPQESARYGCPSTTVYVRVNGTAVTQGLRQTRLEKRPFSIVYRPSNPQRYYSPVQNAVKIIELSY